MDIMDEVDEVDITNSKVKNQKAKVRMPSAAILSGFLTRKGFGMTVFMFRK
jgi:hypothetical protein